MEKSKKQIVAIEQNINLAKFVLETCETTRNCIITYISKAHTMSIFEHSHKHLGT